MFPAFDYPDLVDPLPGLAPAVLEQHKRGWQLLQAGRIRDAQQTFAAALAAAPAFYPARAALGYASLAERDYRAAATAFEAALGQRPTYVPALTGRVEALIADNRQLEAIGALEALLAADPSRTGARMRLETLRLGAIEALVAEAREAGRRGDLEAARTAWKRALDASPQSAFMLRELAGIERQAGRLDDALAHAQGALALDEGDPTTHVLVAEIQAARQSLPEALAAYRRAQELDPRGDYRDRIAEIEKQIDLAGLPAAFRAIATHPQVTRGDLAALLGVKLESWLASQPPGGVTLVTDAREHWALRWILQVAGAGLMEVFPNHTFQPSLPVRRGDLARIVYRALEQAARQSPAIQARLRATPAAFADLPNGHAVHTAASVAVGTGVMQADASGSFAPTRPVSGQDASAAIDRLAALLTRP